MSWWDRVCVCVVVGEEVYDLDVVGVCLAFAT